MISNLFAIASSLLSNLFLWLWFLGFGILWWATRGNRKGRWLGVILLFVFWILSTRPLAEAFLWPLEYRYPVPEIASLQKKGVRQVVVLTGGGYEMRGEMLSDTLPPASAYRFLSGLELGNRLGPDCRIIFSGSAGRGRGNLTTALAMKDLAQLLSPQQKVLGEAQSETTEEHPRNVRPLLNPGAFVLVTSAYHLPRSMRFFQKAGLNPTAYPVNFLSSGNYGWTDALPSFENLQKMNWVFREYLAILFYMARGV
jgi:uncharacterized SAM-binding protein YcdF (DUF218 family)